MLLSIAIRRLEHILSVYGFHLENSPNCYRLTDKGNRIANITYGITTEETYRDKFQDVLSIFFINVNPLYQRRGIATWLLLYTICVVTNQAETSLKYAVLDDVSEEGHRVGPNLYESIGFRYRIQPTRQYMKDGILYWKTYGPERILSIEELQHRLFPLIHNFSKKVKLVFTLGRTSLCWNT